MLFQLLSLPASASLPASGWAADAFAQKASWQRYDAAAMAAMVRRSLDELGVSPGDMDAVTERFLRAIEQEDADPLDALIDSTRGTVPVIDKLASQSADSPLSAGSSIDPNSPLYAELESLPKPLRMSVRTWLGRELVRDRLFDEALPAIAEADPVDSIDPASTLFYRGTCYHALLKKDEALSDLRRLLENEDQCPVRFTRTAQLMIADLKPLKEDSLDEVSRIMTDVTRRLDLGRADDDVKNQEQKIIDKLSKLIEKLEQQQQQQQQSSGGQSGGSQGGQDSPMDDSRIAGASGKGDVDRKNLDARGGWGNLPPAERQEAIQQISRDLPTHYREAIEAYFRKLATDGG
jgi:tetratricopeptide (TPR) repeat protein